MSIVQIWSRHNIEESGIRFFAFLLLESYAATYFALEAKLLLSSFQRLGEIYNFPIVIIFWRNLKELRSREWYGSYTFQAWIVLITIKGSKKIVRHGKLSSIITSLFKNWKWLEALLIYSENAHILVKGKSHFCIDQCFAKRKELHYLNLGGGGLSIWRLLLIVPAPFTTCIQGFVFWVSH